MKLTDEQIAELAEVIASVAPSTWIEGTVRSGTWMRAADVLPSLLAEVRESRAAPRAARAAGPVARIPGHMDGAPMDGEMGALDDDTDPGAAGPVEGTRHPVDPVERLNWAALESRIPGGEGDAGRGPPERAPSNGSAPAAGTPTAGGSEAEFRALVDAFQRATRGTWESANAAREAVLASHREALARAATWEDAAGRFEADALRAERERDEARSERDRLRETLLAKHGGEPLALLAELDEARAALRDAYGDLRLLAKDVRNEDIDADSVAMRLDDIADDAEAALAGVPDPDPTNSSNEEG